MSETVQKEVEKLRQDVENLKDQFLEDKRATGERLFKIEYNMENSSKEILGKIEDLTTEVRNKENVIIKVQGTFDGRYASKRVEVWFDRMMWTIMLGVLTAVLSLVLVVNK